MLFMCQFRWLIAINTPHDIAYIYIWGLCCKLFGCCCLNIFDIKRWNLETPKCNIKAMFSSSLSISFISSSFFFHFILYIVNYLLFPIVYFYLIYNTLSARMLLFPEPVVLNLLLLGPEVPIFITRTWSSEFIITGTWSS